MVGNLLSAVAIGVYVGIILAILSGCAERPVWDTLRYQSTPSHFKLSGSP